MNANELEQQWREATDRDVIQAATIDADGYAPHTQAIIEQEVKRRGLLEEVAKQTQLLPKEAAYKAATPLKMMMENREVRLSGSRPDDNRKHLVENIGPILFRVVWWNHLDPSKRINFAQELFDVIIIGIIRSYETQSNKAAPRGAREFLRPALASLMEVEFGDSWSSLFPSFRDDSYERMVGNILQRRNESRLFELFAAQYDHFTTRIAHLSDSLIDAVELIHEEFIIWLKTHKEHSQRIHADAFEQLAGEILTSHGFAVQFTGRLKNKSADLIAVEKNENGEDVKYLVECKRYADSNKVGLGVLNAVVGASFRAKTLHAMLVTTSSFTSNAKRARAELEDFRLDLVDGEKVMEWLADYEFRDFGLWLPEGWQDHWTND